MYIPDLAPYINSKGEIERNVYAVGWLDEFHSFPKGGISDVVLCRIAALCFDVVNLTRGFHQSPFLDPSPVGYSLVYKGRHMLLGSAEIRVRTADNRTYAAPNLIYHYIKDCGYKPPSEFINAL